jgi:hypothetical protein
MLKHTTHKSVFVNTVELSLLCAYHIPLSIMRSVSCSPQRFVRQTKSHDKPQKRMMLLVFHLRVCREFASASCCHCAIQLYSISRNECERGASSLWVGYEGWRWARCGHKSITIVDSVGFIISGRAYHSGVSNCVRIWVRLCLS